MYVLGGEQFCNDSTSEIMKAKKTFKKLNTRTGILPDAAACKCKYHTVQDCMCLYLWCGVVRAMLTPRWVTGRFLIHTTHYIYIYVDLVE